MKTLNISIEARALFDTLLQIPVGRDYVHPLFPRAEGVVRSWAGTKEFPGPHKVSIIRSKDDREIFAGLGLIHWNLIPHAVSARDLHHSNKPSDKAGIARHTLHSDVHIDVKAEDISWTVANVKHNILFTGGDIDESHKIGCPAKITLTKSWDEIWQIVYNLSQ